MPKKVKISNKIVIVISPLGLHIGAMMMSLYDTDYINFTYINENIEHQLKRAIITAWRYSSVENAIKIVSCVLGIF